MLSCSLLGRWQRVPLNDQSTSDLVTDHCAVILYLLGMSHGGNRVIEKCVSSTKLLCLMGRLAMNSAGITDFERHLRFSVR